jgi:predicted amidohydrolase
MTAGQPQDDNARYWETINRAYAETFGLFMVYGNRVGFEDGVGFWGGSEVVDPFGRRIAKANYYEEDFTIAEVALESVRRKRSAAPLLRDEDIDLTINELLRIRERPSDKKQVQGFKGLRVQGKGKRKEKKGKRKR